MKNHTVKFFSALIIILCFLTSIGIAQKSTNLISGKVTDESGNNVAAKILFLTEKGQRVECKSNSSDGNYQGVLSTNETYYINISGFMIIGLPDNFMLNTASQYAELTQNFTVRKIEKGMPLQRINGFDSGNDNLKSSVSADFLKLNAFMEANNSAVISITVLNNDTQYKAKTVKEPYIDAKGKKKTKSVKITPQDQQKESVKARIEAIKKYYEQFPKYAKRLVFQEDLTPAKAVKAQKGGKGKGKTSAPAAEPDIIITVEKIMNL